jgi:hypothetical protein
MRKFFILLLILAGWAVIFAPLAFGKPVVPELISIQAHPSDRPLPQPWQGSPKIQLDRSPDPQAGGGGGDPLAVNPSPLDASGFQPGSEFTIDTAGFPPQTPVNIGLGLSGSGYNVLSQSQTGADGCLSLTLTLPVGAQPGETGFILVTTIGVPSVQRVSETFTIGE